MEPHGNGASAAPASPATGGGGTRPRGSPRKGGGGAPPGRRSNLPSAVVMLLLVAVNAYLLHSRAATDLVAARPATGSYEREFWPLPEASASSASSRSNAGSIPNADREVDFLDFVWEHPNALDTDYEKRRGEADHHDAFSAAWWQSTAKFVKMKKFDVVGPSPEGASFEIFYKASGDVRMTRDWLDLGVEHMSKWWKVVQDSGGKKKLPVNAKVDKRVVDVFKRYVHSRDRWDFFRALPSPGGEDDDGVNEPLATRSTIVAVAYMTDASERGIWSLAATLISLVQVGMGRVVVASNEQSDEGLVRKSFAIVRNATSSWGGEGGPWTELEFCRSADAKDRNGGVNIPQAALQRIRHVFENRTSSDVAECWLGRGEGALERFRYVFLGEPDLLLVTKPSALPSLGRALAEGRILAPHRLQPLPHGSDFAGISGIDAGRVVPNEPPFEEVYEIDQFADADGGDAAAFTSCCDRGTYKPYLVHDKSDCGIFWWQCGFSAMRAGTSKPQGGIPVTMDAHKRLLGYPLMRLKRGTGVVYASSEWGKTCRPQRGPCKRWKG